MRQKNSFSTFSEKVSRFEFVQSMMLIVPRKNKTKILNSKTSMNLNKNSNKNADLSSNALWQNRTPNNTLYKTPPEHELN